MSLFQSSVINKYLKALDQPQVDAAWQTFAAHFKNTDIQDNIRNSKEEQYQGEFLIDLFVNVMGYTKNPTPNFNLTTELKNVKGSKKTDGAILKDEAAIAVIELKGMNTTDLSKVETQAFGYKNNQPDCVYVITSNFEKLRFYIDNAVDFLEFNLFQLTREEFNLLWICLSSDYLLKNLPKKIKDESLTQEETVTKQLYKDYSAFRKDIFESIVDNNPTYDKLTLFKKTQKLLDRFLFIFFAEDRLLLPPNSIPQIINQWTRLRDEFDEYKPLYERFKKYFGYLNTGHKGKQHDIFAYNGGLFAPDDILDNIVIHDEPLYIHTQKLSAYDFESEVSVNILGHIFEHSLNEIEEIQAEIEGKTTEKNKTKRKKDGVFYTPKYITKYIVDNTVGKLCEEKKAALNIDEAEYEKDRKNRKKATLKRLITQLDDYRAWLLGITICDPACGSGAFLNQALEFLIAEHQYLDELEAKVLGKAIVFTEVQNSILEKNLYGVDINEESVEIAKLSLWLRTAKKGRKLTSLNNNIKCGNSLIDDPEVAGDKAFNWQHEFPHIFEQGGFDVIIGNPPYLRVQGLRENFEKESIFYEKHFASATGRFDIYALFIEKTYYISNNRGINSLILPHKFIVSDFGVGIRSFLVKHNFIASILHFGSEMVFSNASTYTCIINLSRNNEAISFTQIKPKSLFNEFDFNSIPYNDLTSEKWNLRDGKTKKVFNRIYKQHHTVQDIFEGIYQGIVSGDNKAFYLSNCSIKANLVTGYSSLKDDYISIERSVCKEITNGKNIKKYEIIKTRSFIIYPYELKGKSTKLINEDELKKKAPYCFNYLNSIRERLKKRGSKSMNYPHWYSLWNFRSILRQECIKILTPDVCFNSTMYFDESGSYYHNDTSYALVLKDAKPELYKFYLPILNSSLCWFYLKNTSSELRGGYFRFKTKYLNPFPLPKFNSNKNNISIIEKTEVRINSTFIFKDIQQQLKNLLQSKFSIEKLPKKLQNWHQLEFGDFLKELKKQKIKLSLSEEAEWMQYFTEQKEKAQAIQAEIDKTDREIDAMVYELYGLTDEEIAIVEAATA